MTTESRRETAAEGTTGRARLLQGLARAMQAAVGVILLGAVLTVNVAVVVNAALALGVTLLPAILERDYRITLSPGVTLWVTSAVLGHTVGMLGVYDAVWWWDHFTHTLSATVVAAAGYALVRAVDDHADDLYLPPTFHAAFVLLSILALGVFWEVMEFAARLATGVLGLDPVLIQYGLEDTLADLAFDTLGAVVVTVAGGGPLGDAADALVRRLSDGRS